MNLLGMEPMTFFNNWRAGRVGDGTIFSTDGDGGSPADATFRTPDSSALSVTAYEAMTQDWWQDGKCRSMDGSSVRLDAVDVRGTGGLETRAAALLVEVNAAVERRERSKKSRCFTSGDLVVGQRSRNHAAAAVRPALNAQSRCGLPKRGARSQE